MKKKIKKLLKEPNFYLKLIITLLSLVTAVPHEIQLNIKHLSTTTTEITLLVK
jgi:hypothetical protein